MDHAIYTAMGAASQTLDQQAVTASNLANASTPGFRAQLNALRAVPVSGWSLPTRTLVAASTPGADMSQGAMDNTGRTLDVAMGQDGWLAVRTADGSEAYTRNGNMQISSTGILTVQGNPVMGDGGPIAVPQGAELTIAADGTITSRNAGDAPNATVQIGRLKLVKATGKEMQRGDDGMFRPNQQTQATRGAALAADATVQVMPGVLEGSNVKPVETMVDMIANARRFEMQMKVITNVDENEQKANQLLNMSKTGLDAQQTNMDVISNNLANVSTNGFKRSRAVFEDLMYQTLRQPGTQSSEQTTLPSGLQIGTGVRPVTTERLHTQGNLSQTSNSKDVAINGQGYFEVQLPDGTSAYTRDGSFQVDQNGQLVNNAGYPVQPGITIPANATSITISRDGVVSVTQQGQTNPAQVGQLTISTFINDAGLDSMGENLYQETQASGAPTQSTPGQNGAGLLYQGYVETSNVNVAEELVTMIQTQRAYEINSKAISTSDQMLQKLTQI